MPLRLVSIHPNDDGSSIKLPKLGFARKMLTPLVTLFGGEIVSLRAQKESKSGLYALSVESHTYQKPNIFLWLTVVPMLAILLFNLLVVLPWKLFSLRPNKRMSTHSADMLLEKQALSISDGDNIETILLLSSSVSPESEAAHLDEDFVCQRKYTAREEIGASHHSSVNSLGGAIAEDEDSDRSTDERSQGPAALNKITTLSSSPDLHRPKSSFKAALESESSDSIPAQVVSADSLRDFKRAVHSDWGSISGTTDSDDDLLILTPVERSLSVTTRSTSELGSHDSSEVENDTDLSVHERLMNTLDNCHQKADDFLKTLRARIALRNQESANLQADVEDTDSSERASNLVLLPAHVPYFAPRMNADKRRHNDTHFELTRQFIIPDKEEAKTYSLTFAVRCSDYAFLGVMLPEPLEALTAEMSYVELIKQKFNIEQNKNTYIADPAILRDQLDLMWHPDKGIVGVRDEILHVSNRFLSENRSTYKQDGTKLTVSEVLDPELLLQSTQSNITLWENGRFSGIVSKIAGDAIEPSGNCPHDMLARLHNSTKAYIEYVPRSALLDFHSEYSDENLGQSPTGLQSTIYSVLDDSVVWDPAEPITAEVRLRGLSVTLNPIDVLPQSQIAIATNDSGSVGISNIKSRAMSEKITRKKADQKGQKMTQIIGALSTELTKNLKVLAEETQKDALTLGASSRSFIPLKAVQIDKTNVSPSAVDDSALEADDRKTPRLSD